MNRFLFALFAVAVPLAAASYGHGPNPHYLPASSNGIDQLVQAATGGAPHPAAGILGNAEIQPTQAEAARLGQAQAQLEALNANQGYQNLKNSEAIRDSLAESNLASNIRQGNINIVSPNVVSQGVFRSLLVPSGQNNHQVIATQPLPPIVVNQPGSPPAHISSGPASIVRAAPVIYKIKPSVIYQQEVINKVPTPLSLNPVYVKVYKPGKQIDTPTAPVVQPTYQHAAPTYANSASSAAASDSYSNGHVNTPTYGGNSQYHNHGASPNYSGNSQYHSHGTSPNYSGNSQYHSHGTSPNYSGNSQYHNHGASPNYSGNSQYHNHGPSPTY